MKLQSFISCIRQRLILRSIPLFLTVFSVLAASPVFGQLKAEDPQTTYIPTILIVEDDAEAARLEQQGVIIWHRRADMALAAVPEDLDLPDKSRGASPAWRPIRPRRAVPALDVARTMFQANDLRAGRGLPQSYTGRGVVAGFVDTGFDPNHIAFRDADGNSRVKRLICYDEPKGIRMVTDDAAEIRAWTTDNDAMFHGTHVANIMAGSFDGAGYAGMAPDAEIVAATSKLYDAGILAACEDIIDYAKAAGKPAVINLSIGSYNGPHDGTTLFNRYMSLIGRDAIVCMAAGNEGDRNHFYNLTFSEDVPEWRMLLYASNYTQFDMYGLTDAWSADARPVIPRVYIFDEYERRELYALPEVDASGPFDITYNSAEIPGLAQYLTGEIHVRGYVSGLNGRWVTEIEYDTHSTETNPISDGRWARYILSVGFSGAPGVKAWISTDGQYTWARQWPGFPAPNSEMSVSDIATGDNVVVVGMYNSRGSAPKMDGGEFTFPEEPGLVNANSGFGTLIDGRVLPHTVAPGCRLVSACNSYYPLMHPEKIPTLSSKTEVDGGTWYWGIDAGTSMATPYVAGTVACWLEAFPDLTVDDVLDVLESTNWRDYPDPQNPRHGHGWLRPYDGLKYLLSSAGLNQTSSTVSRISVKVSGAVAEVTAPDGADVSVEVYAADGTPARSVLVAGGMGMVDLSGILPGIYLIRATAPGIPPVSTKFLHR